MVVRRTAKETFPCQDSRSQHEHKFAQVPGPIRTIEMVKIMLKDSRKWSPISRGNSWSFGVFVWSLCLCCRLGLCDHCYSGGQCGWHHAEDSKPLHIGKEGWQRNCETSRGLNCLLKANLYVFNWITFFLKSSAIPGYCKDCKCCKFAFWSCTPLSCIMVAAMDPYAPATGSLRRTPALNRNWVPDQALEPNSKDSW